MHRDPLADTDTSYSRLHGEAGDVHDYDDSYEFDEPDELAEALRGRSADDTYVFVNNTHKFEDAARLE